MRTALYLLFLLAILGGADTLSYHEFRARLPAMGGQMRSELQLHALRDFIYAVLFSTIPWIAWQGALAVALAALLLAEVVLTLWDFVVEDWVPKSLGGLYPGERIMHAVMSILYGAMLAYLFPVLRHWWAAATQLAVSPVTVVPAVRWAMFAMGGSFCIRAARFVCRVWPPWKRVALEAVRVMHAFSWSIGDRSRYHLSTASQSRFPFAYLCKG